MHFAANIAVEQDVIVADIVLALFIFTRYWCTSTHTFNRIRLASRMQSRPRPGQNSGTETSSKVRDSRLEFRDRYRDLTICGLCQYFSKNFPKNVITALKLKFFRISVIFPPALVVSHLEIQQKKARWITEIFLSHIVAVLKVSNNRLVTKTCSLRGRDETWNVPDRDSQKWVSGLVSWPRPRPSLETPSFTGSKFAVRHRLSKFAFYKTCAYRT